MKSLLDEGTIELRKQLEEITSGSGIQNIATNLKTLGLREGICDID